MFPINLALMIALKHYDDGGEFKYLLKFTTVIKVYFNIIPELHSTR